MRRFTILAAGVAILLGGGDALAAPGFGGWTFGMTKAQVKQVKACKPYKPVKSTGGLECRNYRHISAVNNISFVFRGGKLAKIQVWLYEGKAPAKAARRLHQLMAHYKKRYGAVESPQLQQPHKLSLAKLLTLVKGMGSSGPAKLQFRPVKPPKKFFTFASMFRHPVHGYYLFHYFQPPR